MSWQATVTALEVDGRSVFTVRYDAGPSLHAMFTYDAVTRIVTRVS